MANPTYVNYWEFKGAKFRFDIYDSQDFTVLSPIKQVYGLILNKERTEILIVHHKTGIWILPGGTTEAEETPIQTLIREVKEETNRELDIPSITPAFYQLSYKQDDTGEWIYRGAELRYVAIVSKDIPFIADPDEGDITEVKWIPVEEFGKYIDWGETNTLIMSIITSKL